VAADKKNAARWRASIVFVDETGFGLIPTVHRTWGLRGQTPRLEHPLRHHGKVSAIGGLSVSPGRRRLQMFLRLVPGGDVSQAVVVAFLRGLLRHRSRWVIVIWDGWAVHRGPRVTAFLARHGRLRVERLPPYAPELNAMDHAWGHMKYHDLANHGCQELEALRTAIARDRVRLRHRTPLLRAFVRATQLPIRL
jgi:transposase